MAGRVGLRPAVLFVSLAAVRQFGDNERVSENNKSPLPPTSMGALRRFLVLLMVQSLVVTAATAETLTWEAAVQEVAGRNAELRSAQSVLAAADEQIGVARAGFFPQLSAGVSHTNVEGSATTFTSSGYSASVIATQNLFAGFQDSARTDQATFNREAAAANLDIVRARLSLDLKTAYAGLLYAQDNVELTGRIAKRLEENVRLIELRFESGRENRGSLLLTRANLAQAQYENLQARQALLAAQTQMARVLGRNQIDTLQLVADLPVAPPGTAPDFDQLLPAVPEYRVQLAQERAANAGLTLARGPFYPSVNLTGSLSRDGADWFPEDDRRVLTASVTIPLFSGGRDYYSARSSAATLSSAEAIRENGERVARQRLRQAFNTYVEATERLKVDAAFVEAAEIRAQIARGKYNNGLMTFEDWDRIETDLIQRYKSALIGKRDRISAEAAWEQAQGKGVIP